MEIFVERGASKGDCLQKITDKYGIWFTVLREKKYRPSGFLGLFSKEKVEVEYYLSPQRWIAPAVNEAVPAANVKSNNKTLSDDTTLNFEEEKKRVLQAAGKDPQKVFEKLRNNEDEEKAQNEILLKLNAIQEKIDSGANQKKDHPSLTRISDMLLQNDFSPGFICGILERARKELPLDILEDFKEVQNRILLWIGEGIKIFNSTVKEKKGRILVLIGPTGVGKTTTIAKLAAIYGLESSGYSDLSVRMISIDAFRIGAKEQIQNYGKIMEIPVSPVDNFIDLKKEIHLYKEETDLLLVDTIGRSPKDSIKLGEMKEMLDACGSKAEIHLVLSAATKTSDISHILQQFEPFNYQAVILTKFDETKHIGNVISALSQRNKPVSYITDGQNVPKDIRKANVVRFLINLEEFHVNRDEIEKYFPVEDTEQFQWGLQGLIYGRPG